MRREARRKSAGIRTVRAKNIDALTGEVLNGTMVLVPEKKKSAFGRDWFAMAQNALEFMALNRKLLGEEGFAVFCKVVAKLDFENFIRINQAALAREISMSPPNFNRALKKLINLGIIIKGPGELRAYRLNPSVGWKGSAKNHFMALQEARAQGLPAIDSILSAHWRNFVENSISSSPEKCSLRKTRQQGRKRPVRRGEGGRDEGACPARQPSTTSSPGRKASSPKMAG